MLTCLRRLQHNINNPPVNDIPAFGQDVKIKLSLRQLWGKDEVHRMLTLEILLLPVVQGDEDGKHDGECPEG